MHTSAKLAVIFIEERVGKSPHVLAHHGAKLFLEVAQFGKSTTEVQTRRKSPLWFSQIIFRHESPTGKVAPQQSNVSTAPSTGYCVACDN